MSCSCTNYMLQPVTVPTQTRTAHYLAIVAAFSPMHIALHTHTPQLCAYRRGHYLCMSVFGSEGGHCEIHRTRGRGSEWGAGGHALSGWGGTEVQCTSSSDSNDYSLPEVHYTSLPPHLGSTCPHAPHYFHIPHPSSPLSSIGSV